VFTTDILFEKMYLPRTVLGKTSPKFKEEKDF